VNSRNVQEGNHASSEEKVMPNTRGSSSAVNYVQQLCFSHLEFVNCCMTCSLYENNCNVFTALLLLLYDILVCCECLCMTAVDLHSVSLTSAM
jgi:hypothetical protein